MRFFYFLLLLFCFFSLPVSLATAQDCDTAAPGENKPGDSLSCLEGGIDHMVVTDACAYPTAASQKNGAVFFNIENTGAENLRVISARSDVADKVELHTHIMDGGVMMMRQVEHYDIPAHSKLVLEPTGNHIMLIGLKRQLKNGEGFVLYLDMENGQSYVMNVSVGQGS